MTPLRMMLHANLGSRPPHEFTIVGDSDIWMFCTCMIEAFIRRVMHFYSPTCDSNALCSDSSYVRSGSAGSQAFERKVTGVTVGAS